MTNGKKKVRKRKRKRLVACLSLLNALVIVYTCILFDADPGFHNSSKKANPSLRLLFVLSASRQRHGQNFNYALSMSRPAWQNAWTKSSPPGPSGRLDSLQARARPFRQSRQKSVYRDVSICCAHLGDLETYLAGLICQVRIPGLVLCCGNVKLKERCCQPQDIVSVRSMRSLS